DPYQLVQFRGPFPADGPGLDPETGPSDGQVGNRVVRRLAASVRHDGRVAGFVSQIDRGARVGERANLVRLNKDSVGRARIDALTESLDIRHEEIVADHLAAVPDAFRQICKRCEVLLVEWT